MLGRIPAPLLSTTALLLGWPGASLAQLRPIDPIDWSDLDVPSVHVSLGTDLLAGQRASLAGTSGQLLELGVFRAVWHLDRVALEISGTSVRVFSDDAVFAEPAQGALPPDGTRRVDAGDVRLATLVRLTPAAVPVQAALRFGVRLPTTNETVGLDRDQTDFFSLLGARFLRGRWDVSGELGVGIFGSRERVDQTDPVLFGLRAALELGPVDPVMEATGQYDTRGTAPRRGTEDLGEVRLGLRAGTDRWIKVTAVRGWTPFSPDFGLSLRVGSRF